MPHSLPRATISKPAENADGSASVTSQGAAASTKTAAEEASPHTPRLGSRKSYLKVNPNNNTLPSTPRSLSSPGLPPSSEPAPPPSASSVQGQQSSTSSHHLLRSVPLPTPKSPSKCPLFCCFYAEFDNKVGPKVCFQTPRNFLHQDIDLPLRRVHEILAETFQALADNPSSSSSTTGDADRHLTATAEEDEGHSPTETDDGHSIFDSCSDFIITGSELTGNIVNLSTHQIHVLSRPTIISNERYERNALLFCVGFVLRRTEDPRPFRPILSKLARTLAEMEDESQFVSSPSTRPLLQRHLERIFVELNSSQWECNVSMTTANVLHAKLFHPPKGAAAPVPEHAVPILLRRDRQVHMYDWDLAINWVSLHIDGVLNARQIAKVAEVDMEMVLSCLRVLRHHGACPTFEAASVARRRMKGVIALVDMFFFTNRYECTPKAASMLAGHHPLLLQAAADFCCRGLNRSSSHHLGDGSPSLQSINSVVHDPGRLLEPTLSGSSSFPDDRQGYSGGGSPGYRNGTSYMSQQRMPHTRREDTPGVRAALAELYCACHRGTSVGDLWLHLLSSRTSSSSRHDWKKLFNFIDHRRFASFGLVHGLLRRLHNFPSAVDSASARRTEDRPANAAPSSVAGTHERTRTPGGVPRQHLPPVGTNSAWTVEGIASLMDGQRCDDDLVSTIELPLESILEMVSDRLVVSVYAPGHYF